jgi:NAD(P)-dependent dehydrogenase (short-subunit alcohol dehydrogenase family)
VTDLVDVVIGAGSGMGAAVAAALQGKRQLLVVDRDQDTAERTAAGLGGGAEAVACDITDAASVEALASRVTRLGALVITAGLSPTMAVGERIFEVNLAGHARVLQAFDAAVGEGTAAVCFASIAGHMSAALPAELLTAVDDPLAPDLAGRLRAAGIDPSEPGGAYGLSKFGVIRLVRRTSLSWTPRGARVLSLSPGIIDTPMGRQELEQQAGMQGMIDLVGRLGTAEELAAVAAFLVSDKASFMNGCDVLVDGGFMALAAR